MSRLVALGNWEMAESACLRRSFSHPSSSSAPREFVEGDPIRALTESISFGRFMSDSLDWGKWSSFSSNRYLEEAEKFSKPGSVAQKKAFFEAHYKKKSVMQAASQIAGVVAPCDSSTEVKAISEAQEASMQLDAIKEVDNDSSLEKQRTGASSVDISFPADDFVAVPNYVMDESKTPAALPDPTEKKDDFQPHVACLCEDLHISEKESPLMESINTQLGAVDRPNSDSREEKEIKLSVSASTPIRTLISKLAKATASSQARTANNAAGNGRKSASKRLEEKRTGPRSLHMSINLASASGLSQLRKTRGTKVSPVFEKERSSSTSTPNQLKAPACAAPKHSLCAPASDVKRIVSILNKSTTELTRMTTDKRSNTLHPSYSRCSTIAETVAKPAAVCPPFGLRSAERAQKRKEFFQKQKERIAAKEAEKRQLLQRSQLPIARPPSPESGKSLTCTNSGSSKSSRRTAAHILSQARKHVQENASPNIPV